MCFAQTDMTTQEISLNAIKKNVSLQESN